MCPKAALAGRGSTLTSKSLDRLPCHCASHCATGSFVARSTRTPTPEPPPQHMPRQVCFPSPSLCLPRPASAGCPTSSPSRSKLLPLVNILSPYTHPGFPSPQPWPGSWLACATYWPSPGRTPVPRAAAPSPTFQMAEGPGATPWILRCKASQTSIKLMSREEDRSKINNIRIKDIVQVLPCWRGAGF